MIGEYINKIKNNLGQLANLRRAVGRYKLLISQFGEKSVNKEVISEGRSL